MHFIDAIFENHHVKYMIPRTLIQKNNSIYRKRVADGT